MNHLNTVLIEGNLTRDPMGVGENSANPGCKFYIANNRYRMGKDQGNWEKETAFFPVLAFGRMGEACARTLKKGRGVRVCGRLKQYTSKNKNNSTLTETTTFILAEHVEFQPERSPEKQNTSWANVEPAPMQATKTQPPAEQVNQIEQAQSLQNLQNVQISQNVTEDQVLSEKALEGVETQITTDEMTEINESEEEYEQADASDANYSDTNSSDSNDSVNEPGF